MDCSESIDEWSINLTGSAVTNMAMSPLFTVDFLDSIVSLLTNSLNMCTSTVMILDSEVVHYLLVPLRFLTFGVP